MSKNLTKEDLISFEQRIDRKFDVIDKRFAAVDGRFEKLEGRTDSRFEEFEGKMDRKFDEMDTKFNDALNNKFSEVIKHFDVVAENIHRDVAGVNADEISLIKQKHDNIETRVSVLEDKVHI